MNLNLGLGDMGNFGIIILYTMVKFLIQGSGIVIYQILFKRNRRRNEKDIF